MTTDDEEADLSSKTMLEYEKFKIIFTIGAKSNQKIMNMTKIMMKMMKNGKKILSMQSDYEEGDSEYEVFTD